MFTFLKKQINTNVELSEQEILRILKISPEAMAEFERYYHTEILPGLPIDAESLFTVNAKQASDITKKELSDSMSNVVERISDELLSLTKITTYDGKDIMTKDFSDICTEPISLEEICTIPYDMRPQLTGRYMHVDILNESHKALLWFLQKMQETKSQKTKQQMYHMFRQGLDILDVDPITSEIIGMNMNSIGHWFPQLVEANMGKGFFQIPKTTIAKLPVSLLQLTRNDFMTLTASTKAIVNRWAMKAFAVNPKEEYFLKTGTYSNKFDFRNCHIHDPKEVMEIGEYLLFIHFSALQMASPLSKPVIYGASTTNEWVVREFISDKEGNPSIYKGLPLHTEYRVFIDCDEQQVLGICPYWEPETMKRRFAEYRDGHDIHDEFVYKAYEETLMSRYERNKDMVLDKVHELIQDLHLTGQWSLDIMQNADDFWLIDMGVAERSAGYDKAVLADKRRPIEENWIPELVIS